MLKKNIIIGAIMNNTGKNKYANIRSKVKKDSLKTWKIYREKKEYNNRTKQIKHLDRTEINMFIEK